jgi:hypothetical protein
VSADYDLRRAIASARHGIDAFTSERDTLYLGFGTDLLGTSDGKRAPAAGRVGFCPPVLAQNETCLAGRLHQHPWNCSVAWTGNEGGHTDCLRLAFLKAYVLPLFGPARQLAPAATAQAGG